MHENVLLPEQNISIYSYQLFKLLKILIKKNPDIIIINGVYPRLNLLAFLWGWIKRKKILYLADTNYLDIKNQNRTYMNTIF